MEKCKVKLLLYLLKKKLQCNFLVTLHSQVRNYRPYKIIRSCAVLMHLNVDLSFIFKGKGCLVSTVCVEFKTSLVYFRA